MRSFSGKVVAVTGAASGIGRALAIRFGAEGAALALCDVNEARLKETARLVEGSPRVTTHLVDVAEREAVAAWARSVEQEHGDVDVIVNNAGVSATATIEDMSYEDLEWVIGIDLWGVIHGVKEFLPLLRKRPEGHIVNISSLNAFVPFPTNGPYNISKYGVAGLSETLMQELSGTRISVTCVHPGGIDTAIVRNARGVTEQDVEEFARVARRSPDAAARTIISGMKKGRKRLFVGIEARILTALKRLFPMGAIGLVAWVWRKRDARRARARQPGGSPPPLAS